MRGNGGGWGTRVRSDSQFGANCVGDGVRVAPHRSSLSASIITRASASVPE